MRRVDAARRVALVMNVAIGGNRADEYFVCDTMRPLTARFAADANRQSTVSFSRCSMTDPDPAGSSFEVFVFADN